TAYGATFTVNDPGDGDDLNPADGLCATLTAVCTLRAAITQANATSGPDTVTFALPGCPGACAINVTGALPIITDALLLDGTTQPGFSAATHVPLVEIKGTVAGAPNGLSVAAGGAGSTIKGL